MILASGNIILIQNIYQFNLEFKFSLNQIQLPGTDSL